VSAPEGNSASVSSLGIGKLPGRRRGLLLADRRTATEVASGTTLLPVAAAGRRPLLTVSEVVDPVERFGPFELRDPQQKREPLFKMPSLAWKQSATRDTEKNRKQKESEAP